MANTKNFNARLPQKHDIEKNWNKATNFIPMEGEIIVYDPDSNYSYSRIKIGDGVTNVINLPFLTDDLQKKIIHNANSDIQIYVVADMVYTIEQFLNKLNINGNFYCVVVDELPQNMIESNSIDSYFYIMNSTGVAYCRMLNTILSGIEVLNSVAGFSGTVQRWTENPYNETEAGIYVKRKNPVIQTIKSSDPAPKVFMRSSSDGVIVPVLNGINGLMALVGNENYFFKTKEMVVNIVPDSLTVSDPTKGILYIYIEAGSGIAYVDIGNGKETLGHILLNITDFGWVKNPPNEQGVFVIKEYFNENTIYRMSSDLQGWVYHTQTGMLPLEKMFELMYGVVPTVNYYLINDFSESIIASDMNNAILHIYVLQKSGIGYVKIDGDIKSAGTFAEMQDMGWTIAPDEETTSGVYFQQGDGLSYQIYYKGHWTKLADTNYNDLLDTFTLPNSSQFIGSTVTWDEDIQGKNVTYLGVITLGEDTFVDCYGVKVSSSVPTLEDLTNTWRVTLINGGSIESTDERYTEVTETNEEITLQDPMDGSFAIKIIKTGTEAGIYFSIFKLRSTQTLVGCKSFTIDGYNFISLPKEQKVIKEELLENFIQREDVISQNIGSTIYWDGEKESRTVVSASTTLGDNQIDINYVYVSDSVPTSEILLNGFSCVSKNYGSQSYDPNEGYHWLIISEDENCTYITHADGLGTLPFIVKKPFIDEESGIFWPKAGIYFSEIYITQNGIKQFFDRGTSFTIPEYSFNKTFQKKTIKSELISVDTTLTESGKPADAKAVGDAIANISITYNINSAGVLYPSIGIGTAWIGMQDNSLLITQASNATLNNNELEVQ